MCQYAIKTNLQTKHLILINEPIQCLATNHENRAKVLVTVKTNAHLLGPEAVYSGSWVPCSNETLLCIYKTTRYHIQKTEKKSSPYNRP